MKNNKLLTIMLGLLVLAMLSAYADVTVNIQSDPSFSENQTMHFNYQISSEKTQDITYRATVDCPNAPVPSLAPFSAQLNANTTLEGNFTYAKVTNALEPQACNATVEILSPIRKVVQKAFDIITNPSLLFKLFVCRDNSCNSQLPVFVRNETVYLSYTTDVSSPNVLATLTYPNDLIQQITLPASIIVKQPGIYSLDVTISKSGFKTITSQQSFNVLAKHLTYAFVGACKVDNACTGQETPQNCPQDCTVGTIDSLTAAVNAISPLSNGIRNSLLHKIEAASHQYDLGHNSAGNNQLSAFISEVNAQIGHTLTTAQADFLISLANQIIAQHP